MNLLMIIKALCIILDTTIDTICKIELMFISISDFVWENATSFFHRRVQFWSTY